MRFESDSETIRLDEVDEEDANESGIFRGVGSSGRGRRRGAGSGVNVSLATCNWIPSEFGFGEVGDADASLP